MKIDATSSGQDAEEMKLLNDLSVVVALCGALIGACATAFTVCMGLMIDLLVGKVSFVTELALTMTLNGLTLGLLMFWIGRKSGLSAVEETGAPPDTTE